MCTINFYLLTYLTCDTLQLNQLLAWSSVYISSVHALRLISLTGFDGIIYNLLPRKYLAPRKSFDILALYKSDYYNNLTASHF